MREVVVVVALAHEREELLSGEECRHAMAQSFGHLWQGHTDGPHAIGNVVRGHELTLGILVEETNNTVGADRSTLGSPAGRSRGYVTTTVPNMKVCIAQK